jgi:hypothetical protein
VPLSRHGVHHSKVGGNRQERLFLAPVALAKVAEKRSLADHCTITALRLTQLGQAFI